MVTHLPDPVVGFLVVSTREGVKAFSLPFHGEYDTYGALEFEGDPEIAQFTIEFITKKMLRHESFEYQLRKIPPGESLLPNPLTMKAIIREAERATTRDDQAIYVPTFSGERRLLWSMVHKFAFDLLVEGPGPKVLDDSWDRGEGTRDLFEESPFDPCLFLHNSVSNTLPSWLRAENTSEVVWKAFIDLLMFDFHLRQIRQQWFPQGQGKGSQDQCFDLRNLLVTEILQHIEKVVKSREE
jgi:hypothetical protein